MLKYILFFVIISISIFILLFFLFLILFILFVYLFIYYLLRINNNFADYDEKSKKIINKYGDYKVIKMYYYKEYLLDTFIYYMNIFTFYRYYHYFNKYKPYHMGCIVILKNSHNKIKFLKIHKQTKIYICEKFNILLYKKLKDVSIHKNKYSLKEFLDRTKKNMGEKNYFNWELVNNNCEHFVKSLIQSIQKKQTNFSFQKNIFNKSDVYLLNTLVILFYYFYVQYFMLLFSFQ